eukprot:RCo029373
MSLPKDDSGGSKKALEVTLEDYHALRSKFNLVDPSGSGLLFLQALRKAPNDDSAVISVELFEQVDTEKRGYLTFLDVFKARYPLVKERELKRVYATYLSASEVRALRRSFLEITHGSDKMYSEDLLTAGETLDGMRLTVQRFETIPNFRNGVTADQVVSLLYPSISVSAVRHYFASEISRDDVVALQEEWKQLDPRKCGAVTLKEISITLRALCSKQKIPSVRLGDIDFDLCLLSTLAEGNGDTLRVTFPALLQFLFPCVSATRLQRYLELYAMPPAQGHSPADTLSMGGTTATTLTSSWERYLSGRRAGAQGSSGPLSSWQTPSDLSTLGTAQSTTASFQRSSTTWGSALSGHFGRHSYAPPSEAWGVPRSQGYFMNCPAFDFTAWRTQCVFEEVQRMRERDAARARIVLNSVQTAAAIKVQNCYRCHVARKARRALEQAKQRQKELEGRRTRKVKKKARVKGTASPPTSPMYKPSSLVFEEVPTVARPKPKPKP